MVSTKEHRTGTIDIQSRFRGHVRRTKHGRGTIGDESDLQRELDGEEANIDINEKMIVLKKQIPTRMHLRSEKPRSRLRCSAELARNIVSRTPLSHPMPSSLTDKKPHQPRPDAPSPLRAPQGNPEAFYQSQYPPFPSLSPSPPSV